MADKPKSKYNFGKVAEEVKATLKKDSRDDEADSIGVGSELPDVSRKPEDYVVMPTWWEEQYGVLGLPFGKIVQVAGDSDTGKTSLCITAMKAAQEQGFGIVYVETEGKTSTEDLQDWGVDPEGIILIKTNITEKAFDSSFRAIQAFFRNYPKEKLLFVFDSFGNTISLHDEELDLVTNNSKVGGAAKTNRIGLGRLIALMQDNPIAILLVNYTYDNIGSVGKVEAGGKALKFWTMLGIHSQRTGDWIRTIDKKKVRAGAFVKWSTFKNHYQKSAIDKEGKRRVLPKEATFRISAAGIEKTEGKQED